MNRESSNFDYQWGELNNSAQDHTSGDDMDTRRNDDQIIMPRDWVGGVKATAKALGVILLLAVWVIFASGCSGAAPTEATRPPTQLPPTHFVFYDIAGSYHAADSSTMTLTSMATPDSVYGSAYMPDGTHYALLVARHGDGGANTHWVGIIARDSGPEMQATIDATPMTNRHGGSTWALTLGITIEGDAVQQIVFTGGA